MPERSPFYERLLSQCTSHRWKDWAGYYAVCYFEDCHEPEYHAVRQACGLLDVTPLFKYEVRGPDAAAFLSWVVTQNIRKLGLGRVTYTSLCDEEGKMVDDGTVMRLGEDHYRVTSAEPTFAWLERHAAGFDVHLEDASRALGALAVQGPTSRATLNAVLDDSLDGLRYFGAMSTRLGDASVTVTRTGFTGDLGYEVWVPREHALAVYDAILAAGRPHGIRPMGLDALDMTRVEAGFVIAGVDYYNARRTVVAQLKSTPYELGLGWTVKLDREPFIGQQALRAERARGPAWNLVGLSMDWDAIRALFDARGLPPHIPAAAWRTPTPVYEAPAGRQVGYATSGTWSPLLKQNLAMAHIETPWAQLGRQLHIEITVMYERRTVPATVVKRPFFDPPRKRAP